ncbi:XrtY-associated glycosyltransferase XYAG1 [Arcticibacter sp. MXS-1]|uniref:XrtY-associated glycosyltransferase XYAG1 n=1 Tax=Arcticibacter sp. MXS-1 TaxID=3341726 RepID=UPI0035A88706
MKILHIAPVYKPAYVYGGPIESVAKLCEGLVNEGQTVHVYTSNANGVTDLPVAPNVEVLVDGVSVTYFRALSKSPTFMSPALWRAVYSNASKYDVIHIHSWWNILVIISALICTFKGLKVVFAPRGMLSRYILNSGRASVKKFIHLGFGAKLLSKTYLHATAESEYRECNELIPGWKGFVLPNILSLPEIEIVPPANDIFTLVYLSRIHPKKGLEILFDAISSVEYNLILKIAGSGEDDYVRRLKAYADHLGISHKVEWVGWKSRHDKYLEFMAADLFVLVSRNENFANVVIESLHMGTPVLISEDVGLSDFVKKENMGWVSTLGSENVRDNLTAAFLDVEKRERIRKEGREVIRNTFSEKKLIGDYIKQYENFISNQK